MSLAAGGHSRHVTRQNGAESKTPGIRITNIKAAQAALNELSRQLLTLQEEERQRIAIELHDSTSQHLIALELNLMNLRRKIASHDELEATLNEMELSVREAQKEIRIFSYLLHPPHLEIDGLKSTIEHFVDGFSRRADLAASVSIAIAVDHLELDLQRCILRVVQEALANVHRHAEAKSVEVNLALQRETLTIRIKDNGKGITRAQLWTEAETGCRLNGTRVPLGLGLPGMLARLQQFNGTLEIVRLADGTEVLARIPLPSKGHRTRRGMSDASTASVDLDGSGARR